MRVWSIEHRVWGAVAGRADHPWSAAVEQGCSTLPRDTKVVPEKPTNRISKMAEG